MNQCNQLGQDAEVESCVDLIQEKICYLYYYPIIFLFYLLHIWSYDLVQPF